METYVNTDRMYFLVQGDPSKQGLADFEPHYSF